MNKEIFDVESRCVERHIDLAGHINRISENQAQVELAENVATAKEVVSHLYKEANSYSNLIIAAGYVAFFTLWSTINDELPIWAVTTSGALIIFSVMLFIGFELYKMISTAILINRITSDLEDPDINTLTNIQRIEKKSALRNGKVWIYTLIPTVLTGFGAGMILLFCFITEFAKAYI